MLFFFAITGAAGKKNRQKERRLMKGFNLATGAGGTGAVGGGPPVRGSTGGAATPGSIGKYPECISYNKLVY